MTALGEVLGVVVSACLCLLVGWYTGLVHLAATSLIIQWLAFIPAYILQTEHFYDLTGSLTFLTLMAMSYLSSARTPRQTLATCLVLIWTLRLGTFLVLRIHKVGKDSRFDRVKSKPVQFLQFWTVQGLWVMLTALPVLILSTKGAKSPRFPQPLDILGLSVWILGFGTEVIADSQKASFNRANTNRREWIDVGLWRYSRHPNYLGEVTLWLGALLLCASAFETKADLGLGLLSPAFVYILLSQISIPMTEKGAEKRWGESTEYRAYVQRVPPLWPRLSLFVLERSQET